MAGSDIANGCASSLTETRVAGGKPRQQRAPRRVGERGKGVVQIALPRAVVILNHVV